MKRLTKFSLVLMLLVASVAVTKAQSKGEFGYGLKIGAVYSNFANSDYSGRYGWTAGAFGEYALTDKMGFSVELLYSEQGGRIEEGLSINADSDPYYTREHKLSYIQVPVMYRFNIWKGLNLKAGVQTGYLVKEKEIYKRYDKEERPDIEDSPYATIDLSIPLAVSYSVSSRIAFEYRYNLGIRTINDGCNPEYKNRWMNLSMFFKF
ncbi:MAG: porin family protein [Rikenellaceae bacterium]